MACLVDTNLLLRAAQPDHPVHTQARDAVRELLERGEELVLTRQNLVEFWVVATRVAGANGLGLTANLAETELQQLEQQFRILPDCDEVYDEWRTLVRTHGITGYRAYDARLIASMRAHGVGRILTFNTNDFRPYPGIELLHPDDVLQPAAKPKPVNGTDTPPTAIAESS